jgi:hypothetical protein
MMIEGAPAFRRKCHPFNALARLAGHLGLALSIMFFSSPTPAFAQAAPNDASNWVETAFQARGGCDRSFQIFSDLGPTFSHSRGISVEASFLGTPLQDWTDTDIEVAVRILRSCEARGAKMYELSATKTEGLLRGAVQNVRARQSRLDTERAAKIEAERQQAQATREREREQMRKEQEAWRDKAARDAEEAREAEEQRTAKMEFERQQAQQVLERKRENMAKQQEALRAKAAQDLELAKAANEQADREQEKLTEVLKEAEAARQARQAAEARLAENRRRLEAERQASSTPRKSEQPGDLNDEASRTAKRSPENTNHGTEQQQPTAALGIRERSVHEVAQMMANINGEGYVRPGDISINRFRFLIGALLEETGVSPERIADMLVAGRKMLKDTYGKNVGLLELTEAAYSARTTAGRGERSFGSMVAMIVTLIGKE